MATDETHEIQLDEFAIENDLPALSVLGARQIGKMFWLLGNGCKSYTSSICSCG